MLKLTLIAAVAHAVNAAYCTSLGDTSTPAWADATPQHQANMLAGVEMHLANPDATPEASHAAWLAAKTAEGWTYADVKNTELKQHPCMVPYEQLPAAQKSKDYLFRAVVHALAALPDAEPTAVVDSAYTSIKYVGRRASHTDGMYGTRLTWAAGETLQVPAVIAAKMLAHPDVYQLGEPVVGVLPPLPDTSKAKEEQVQEDRAFDMRQSIAAMNKDGVVSFVKTNFRVDLDKKQSVASLRAQATQLVDQYGVA